VIRRLLLIITFVAAGFAGGLAVSGRNRAMADAATAPVPAPLTVEPAAAAPEQRAAPAAAAPTAVTLPGPDFTRVASQAVKAVVNISSERVVQRRNSPFADDPFFRNFFFGDDPFGGSRRSLSLGSGVIVSADGYVVTNSHVVGEDLRRTRVTISLADKREVPAAIVGTDPATDLAVLKMDVKGVSVLPWGDSSKLQVGEWVLAIGSPFQLSQTVTAGIVSATGRANVGFAAYEDFIQTDAAINPGNSGGALVNTSGELVGINTGIFSQSGGYQGIGFAAPSVLAQRIVKDLTAYGEVRRGIIDGIQLESMTPQIAQQLGAPVDRGALVVALSRGATATGFRRWDIITAFNGTEVQDLSQLFRMVADSRIGSTATVTVLRESGSVELKVPIVSSSTR
jgi:Do/DeqQ family serine protease